MKNEEKDRLPQTIRARENILSSHNETVKDKCQATAH